jgi:hypothetical protein
MCTYDLSVSQDFDLFVGVSLIVKTEMLTLNFDFEYER